MPMSKIRFASLIAIGALCAAPRFVSAQTLIEACYVPASGTVYRIKVANAPSACLTGHLAFSWTSGALLTSINLTSSSPAFDVTNGGTGPAGWFKNSSTGNAIYGEASGTGAVFTVRLPLPSSELSLERVPPPARVDQKVTEVDLKDVRILVVEDELDALDLLTIDLTAHGAKVRGAASAAEAIELLRAEQFDLMISDIGMADTDGYNLIKQVRRQESEHGEHIPAIALTAYARTQDRIRALTAGYNTHVAKPVEIKELVTVVKCLIGKIG